MKPRIPLAPEAVNEWGLPDTTGMAPTITEAGSISDASRTACGASTR